MADAPTYAIESVWDFLNVPEDRLDECMREFRIALDMARATCSLLTEVGAEMGIDRDAVKWLPKDFVWTDDNLGTMTLAVRTTPEVIL